MTSPLIGGVPVSHLKAALKAADDELLGKFLHGYALGFAADQFIANMNNPDERSGFILSLAEKYPEDWAKATKAIKDALIASTAK